jgi:1-phosphofructokinase
MIITVTPNPSVDRTLRVPSLTRGQVIRALSATAEAGGKGINVSRALATEGHATAAVVPLSNASASVMRALLRDATPVEVVPIAGEVRVNVSVVEADGTVTKLNEPGPVLADAEVAELLQRTAQLAEGAAWVVGCGSLPPGVPADFYARLAGRLADGARVAIDADGAALKACIGQRIALIKPNHVELEGLVGRSLPTLGDVVEAATELLASGIASVLVSLGPDGAVLVDSTGAQHAEARIADLLNTVGAGDALLAGFLAAGGTADALRTGVAWSVAACRSPGTQMRPVTPEDIVAVTVHPGPLAGRRLAA